MTCTLTRNLFAIDTSPLPPSESDQELEDADREQRLDRLGGDEHFVTLRLWQLRDVLRGRLPASTLVTFHVLQTFARGTGRAWPGNPLLARLLGVSQRVVQLHLRDLEKVRWIERPGKGPRRVIVFRGVGSVENQPEGTMPNIVDDDAGHHTRGDAQHRPELDEDEPDAAAAAAPASGRGEPGPDFEGIVRAVAELRGMVPDRNVLLLAVLRRAARYPRSSPDVIRALAVRACETSPDAIRQPGVWVDELAKRLRGNKAEREEVLARLADAERARSRELERAPARATTAQPKERIRNPEADAAWAAAAERIRLRALKGGAGKPSPSPTAASEPVRVASGVSELLGSPDRLRTRQTPMPESRQAIPT